LICLLSTYTKLGCDHYYSDVAFLKPNKNFTIVNSADIWLSFSQVDTVLSKSGFKKLSLENIFFLLKFPQKNNAWLNVIVNNVLLQKIPVNFLMCLITWNRYLLRTNRERAIWIS
jgi:hypothetical protein